MRPFVFRAQVALDLRRRRDDEAKRDLAAANGAVAIAESALAQSVAARTRALDDARTAETNATDTVTLEWYRNWITSQQRDVSRRQDELEVRRTAAAAARERAIRAHMDVRVLEKLKERASRTYDLAVRREEQKEIDWLAVLRSVSRDGGREGSA
jgi:flagellar export protein FliJ